jgi:8-oxo-dGTP pyrophosphatase MutT (NUDIX family)
MGGIKAGKSPQDAIIREADEEIGITIIKISLASVLFADYRDAAQPANTFYGLRLFFCG